MSQTQLILTVFLAVLYGLLSWHFYRRISNKHFSHRHHNHEHAVLGVLLLLHSYAVFMSFDSQFVMLGAARAVALVVWLMLVIYWTGSFFYRLEGLQLFLMPLAAFSLVLTLCFPPFSAGYPLKNVAFSLHLLVSLLAYSMFAISVLLAVFMLMLDSTLHHKRNFLLIRNLPSLLGLEHLMFQVVLIGFILLSFSLLSGVLFSEQLFNRVFAVSHKTVFGLISWLIFAVLLAGRWILGWRGRQAIYWLIAGSIALLLTYIGSKFILELAVQHNLHI